MVEGKYEKDENSLSESVKKLIKSTLIAVVIASGCAVLTCYLFANL